MHILALKAMRQKYSSMMETQTHETLKRSKTKSLRGIQLTNQLTNQTQRVTKPTNEGVEQHESNLESEVK